LSTQCGVGAWHNRKSQKKGTQFKRFKKGERGKRGELIKTTRFPGQLKKDRTPPTRKNETRGLKKGTWEERKSRNDMTTK